MEDKIFRKLTRRTIRDNFKQFLSVILIVFLGTMLLSGFIANSSTLSSSVDRYFEKTCLAKTWLYVSGINDDDIAFYDELSSTSNFQYQERLYVETSASIQDSTASGNAKIYVSNQDVLVSKPYIESGIIGCLIDKNVAKSNDIAVTFDYIVFSISQSVYIEDVGFVNLDLDLKFNITGTMSLDECADTYSAWPVYIDETIFLAELNTEIKAACACLGYTSEMLDALNVGVDKVPYNQILLSTDEESVLDQIESYYQTSSSSLVQVLDRNLVESVVLLNSEVSQSKKMIYVFPVIFMVVSILVILTTIDQLVLQEKQKIGTLKSIGIKDRKILRHYSKFGAILCFIGAILGIVLGVLVIPKIMFIKYNLVYSIPIDYVSLKIPFLWLLLVLLGVVLLGYIISLFTCRQILHKKPIECLRFDLGVKSSRFKKTKGKYKNVPLSLKMATRNIKLKPVRTLMATIGIAGCVALLLCGFGIGNTLTYSINNDYGKVFSFDVQTTYAADDFENNLNDNNFENYELYKRFYAETASNSAQKNVSVYIISPNSAFTSFKLDEGGVFMSKSVASSLGVNVGDSITVSCGAVTTSVQISQIGETSVMNGIYVAGNLGFSELYATNGAWFASNNPDELVEQLNLINGTNSAKTMNELKDSANSKISSINLMTNTLKFFAIMLAIIVLLNLIFLILKERTRELATLKVLGKDMFNITLSIYFEVLFMVILGLIVGMVFGYPLLVLVLTVNKVEVVNFIYHLSFSSFIWTILLVILTHALMTVFCYFKVKKINMIESLKSVE